MLVFPKRFHIFHKYIPYIPHKRVSSLRTFYVVISVREKDFELCKHVSVFQKNVKDLMDSNGIRILVDLLTLAHLHVSRATVPLQVCMLI